MTNRQRLARQEQDSEGDDFDRAADALEPWIVELLACPLDQGAVMLIRSELVCDLCGRRYPIRGGIPEMLPHRGRSEQKF
jgi:uncharacterized protein YbaR (Trm112 family)